MDIVIDFVALFCIYWIVFYPKWKPNGKKVLLINTMLYTYLSFVLYVTLMPIVTSLPFIRNHPYVPMKLVPFRDLLNSRGDFIRQVVLNIAMTIGGMMGYACYILFKP